MLGSVPDAEDALQETLLRAWRGLARFEGRSSLRSWLYTDRDQRQPAGDRAAARSACSRSTTGPRPTRTTALGEPLTESVWLEPYPDAELGLEAATARPGRALRAAREHRARLHRRAPAPARAAARRADPPRRARLLGPGDRRGARDDAGLGRQRAAARPQGDRRAPARADASRRRCARSATASCARSSTRFVDAWERNDVDAVVAMLADDARMTMPPCRAGTAAATRSRPSSAAGRSPLREALAAPPDRRQRPTRRRRLPLGRAGGRLHARDDHRAHPPRRAASRRSPPSSTRALPALRPARTTPGVSYAPRRAGPKSTSFVSTVPAVRPGASW